MNNEIVSQKKLNINQRETEREAQSESRRSKGQKQGAPTSAMNKSLGFPIAYHNWTRLAPGSVGFLAVMPWYHGLYVARVANVFLFFFCLSLNYSYFTIGGVQITIWDDGP